MKRIMFSLYIICLIGMASCKNDLISMDEELLDKTKDISVPVLVIDSPETESLFDQTVLVTGYVSDDGGVLPGCSYSVENELGEILSEGSVELTSESTDNGVKGAFSFSFSTSSMASDVLLNLRAEDWNGNEAEPVSLRLLYPGSAISSLEAEAGNNTITISWDPIPEADSYTLYYSPKGEVFSFDTAHSLTYTAEEIGDTASVSLNSDEHAIANGWLTQLKVKAESESDSWESPLLSVIPVSSFSLLPKSNCHTDKIELFWKPVHTADEEVNYTVWRSSEKEGTYTQISSDNLSESHYTDNTASSGVAWYYKIGYAPEEGVTAEVLSAAHPAQLTALSSSLADSSEIMHISDSQLNEIRKVAFAPGGTRAFALDYIDKTHWRLWELNTESGAVVGNPVDIQSVSTDVYNLSRASVYGPVVTASRVYVSTSLKNSSTETVRQILSFDITTPGIMVLKEAEIITFGSSANPICLGNHGGTDTLYYKDGSICKSVDVSNPASPGAPFSHTALDGQIPGILDMEYTGGWLYVLYKGGDDVKLLSYNVDTHAFQSVVVVNDPVASPDYATFCMDADSDSGNLVIGATSYQYQGNYPLDEGTLWYYDIGSDLLNPGFQVTGDIGIRVEDLKIKGNIAYCSTYNGYVIAVGLSELSGFTILSESTTPGYGVNLDLADNRVIVAGGSSAASVVTMQNSDILYGDQFLLTFSGFNDNSISYDSSYLYVPQANPFSLKSYSVAADGSLSFISELSLTTANALAYGGYLFTGYEDLFISVLPENGRVNNLDLNTVSLQGIITGLDIWGDYLYIAQGNFGVEIFDISDPGFPVSVAWVNSYNKAADICVQDDMLLLGDGFYGIYSYDVSNPDNPVVLGTFRDTASNLACNGLAVSGDYVYYSTSTGLYVLNKSDASYWRSADSGGNDLGSALHRLDGIGIINGLSVQGSSLYAIQSQSGTRFAAIDISVPGKPELNYIDYSGAVLFGGDKVLVLGNHIFTYSSSGLDSLIVQ